MENNYDVKIKYEALFVLHSLGDIIGFKNGDWEFNKGKLVTIDSVNEYIYEFIHLGGINGLDINTWISSDDTLYHLATAKTMLEYNGKINSKFILEAKNQIILIYNQIIEEKDDNKIDRAPGYTMNKYISKFTEDTDALDHPYDNTSGGNGSAMKSLCIGACLYGEEKREELIRTSIRLSQITHNSPTGYMGGLTTALLTAFAIEGLEIQKWPFELLKILQSRQVKETLDKNNMELIRDYLTYIKHWITYVETRFNTEEKPIYTKSQQNPLLRMKYYFENFVKDTTALQVGESSYACIIIAYDCLLDSKGNWEKLVIYSMLHPGDTDTIGAVAGGLYGILYGYGDVPDKLIKQIEYLEELKNISNKIYEKYYEKK